jgi:hypothetical protein
LEIADFHVALRRAAGNQSNVSLVDPDEMAGRLPVRLAVRNPFSLRVNVRHRGAVRQIGLVPDFVFGLRFANSSQRNFMVEIDRGTMPVSRSDFTQSSIEKKMRAYLAAHTARLHERHFGWKSFRVLVVTTDEHRMQNMTEALRSFHVPGSIGPSLLFFATREELRERDPLDCLWRDGTGKSQRLVA